MMFGVFSITQSITYASRSTQEGPCGMPKVVIFWPLTTKSRTQFKASPCWVCGVRSGTGTGFSPSTSIFNQYHATHAPFPFICHWVYRKATDRISKTREAIDIQCNTEVHSRNRCCIGEATSTYYTRWFKYYRDYLCVNEPQSVPVIFEPPCILWSCVCGLSYPACNMRTPYCHLWTVWLYNIFPHYLINGMIK
jgi:hypothetical protein